MPTETDLRLRSWLDANQRDREQMCRSVLALDPHYTDVRPRHPSGGPDGGRDIEAIFNGDHIAYGAVGFHNGANDSDEQKKQIRSKFSSDLRSALGAKSDLEVFVFLTNLHFTMGEQSEMKEEARRAGLDHCDILDRERLRIELDSPSGFFVRFQYLGIPLSEAEQASFLARYGDRIQEVVSTGFQRIERTLNRILFLQESENVLEGISVHFRLKATYPAVEIGHFRAFMIVYLGALKHGILAISFGASDKSDRFRTDVSDGVKNQREGIAHGIAHGQWETHVKLPSQNEVNASAGPIETDECAEWDWSLIHAGSGSSNGINRVSSITIRYSHDETPVRSRPRLELRDLDRAMLIPMLNRSLAEKVQSIEVLANGYKLDHIGPEDLEIDPSPLQVEVPGAFTPEELADPWVQIRSSQISSTFLLRFLTTTPRRILGHYEMPDLDRPESS